MARLRITRTRPSTDDWQSNEWPYTMPVPETREGGESSWELWDESSRRLEVAFAPTEPTAAAPLAGEDDVAGPDAGQPAPVPLNADELMVFARRNNRICPRPAQWVAMYELLEGSRHEDLPPPPVQPWQWTKLSALQKRLRFREHVAWAERHGRLNRLARFIGGLAETDWLHIGENDSA